MDLDLVSVPTTLPEKILLRCLQRLVLKGIVEVAPWTDACMQANKLLKDLNNETKAPGGSTTDEVSVAPGGDGSWRFPNKAYTALCQQAFSVRASHISAVPATGFGINLEDSFSTVIEIMNLAFAMDEVGGEATWRLVLEKLEKIHVTDGGDLKRMLSETVRVPEEYLSDDSSDERKKGAVLPETAAK